MRVGLIGILWLTILTLALGQTRDQSEIAMEDYYSGIVLMKKGKCPEANQRLNTFITDYNGSNQKYWKQKAASYIKPCQDMTNDNSSSSLTYEYRPKWNKKSGQSILVTINSPDFVSIYPPSPDVTTRVLMAPPKTIWPISREPEYASPKLPKDIRLFPEPNMTPLTNKKYLEPMIYPDAPILISMENIPLYQGRETKPSIKVDISEIPQEKEMKTEYITSTYQKHHYKILFAIDDTPDHTYLSLSDIGPVTNESANGNLYLYYTGFYDSKEKAEANLEKVKRRGFPNARIMEFDSGKLEKEYLESAKSPMTGIVTPDLKSPTLRDEDHTVTMPRKTQIKAIKKDGKLSYHILFRVLDNPYETFDDLKPFGQLYRETFDNKGNSRYLIGDTSSLIEAAILLKKVKQAGYPISFIAEYKNGNFVKIINQ